MLAVGPTNGGIDMYLRIDVNDFAPYDDEREAPLHITIQQ